MAKPKKQTPPSSPTILCAICAALSTIMAAYGGLLMNNVLAPWLLATSVALGAGALVTSPEVWRPIRNHLTKSWQRRSLTIAICLLFFVPTLLIFNHVASSAREKEANTIISSGYIFPGSGDNPVSPEAKANIVNLGDSLPIPSNTDLTVMLGDKVGVYMRKDQNYIIAQQGKPLVSIGFDDSGAMLINAEVFDSNNNQVVKIVDSEFHSNPNFAFKVRQLTTHSLTINDSLHHEVLNIDYINSTTIRLSGRFHISGYSEPFTISSSSDIHFDGLFIDKTKPFMFDMRTVPDPYFVDITANGGVRLGGHTFGEGSAK